jgi:uncharacterized repeat protein (TIGR03803 family)
MPRLSFQKVPPMRELRIVNLLLTKIAFCTPTAVLLVTLMHLPAAQAQAYTPLYLFSGGSDGAGPSSPLILGSSGSLIGSAAGGGDFSCNAIAGCGVIFELSTEGETVLHTFTGPDGISPSGPMVADNAGNLYGTTREGGNLNVDLNCPPGGNSQGCGVAFKLNKATGKLTVLYAFQGGTDGGLPYGLVGNVTGNLYGITTDGGNSGCGGYGTCGTIYELNSTGKHVLYSFTGGTDGGTPISVISDNEGNLYGMTEVGGDLSCQPDGTNGAGCGVVFELTAGGVLKVLHAFTGGKDGSNYSSSSASLLLNSAGTLFGTSPLGGLRECPGNPGCGVVFQITPTGKYTVLYSFDGGANGGDPAYSLTSDSSGNLYSTTLLGGDFEGSCYPAGCGTVFKLDPTSGELATLYAFTGGALGFYPEYLTSDAAGNLYGEAQGGGDYATAGMIFEITQ